jgi:hypothetical protein
MQAISEIESSSFSDAASSITARWRPEYSEDHGPVDHRQSQMRRRIVDGDAGVLGDRHDDQPDQHQPQRDAQADIRRQITSEIVRAGSTSATRPR